MSATLFGTGLAARAPTHLHVSHADDGVITSDSASCVDAIVSVRPLDENGIVKDARQTLKTGRHGHAMRVSPDNGYAFAFSLASDQLAQCRFDAESGQLTVNVPATLLERASFSFLPTVAIGMCSVSSQAPTGKNANRVEIVSYDLSDETS